MVCVGVQEAGLLAFLALDPRSVPEFAEDIEALQEFLREHGTRHIFEYATF